jgi:hypothetical protein
MIRIRPMMNKHASTCEMIQNGISGGKGEGPAEEERKPQEVVDRKEARTSRDLYPLSLKGYKAAGWGKDDEDDLPDESSAKRRSRKANKKRGGDQGASACKTASWATSKTGCPPPSGMGANVFI